MTRDTRGDLWRDFPKTAAEFEARFVTEDDCRAYWIKARWGGKPACARCHSTRVWIERNGFLFECADCGHQTSLTSGTVLEKTRKPFRTWFRAVFEISTRQSISAKDLQRIMGFGSYKTAWNWLHKLRADMVLPSQEPLGPFVKVGETLIGGKGSSNKRVVDARVDGRVRLVHAENNDEGTLKSLANSRAALDAHLTTDGLVEGHTELTDPPPAELFTALEGLLKMRLRPQARCQIWESCLRACVQVDEIPTSDALRRLKKRMKSGLQALSQLHSLVVDMEAFNIEFAAIDSISTLENELELWAYWKRDDMFHAIWSSFLLNMQEIFELLTGTRATASWYASKEMPTGRFAQMMLHLRPYLPPELRRSSQEAFIGEVKKVLYGSRLLERDWFASAAAPSPNQ